MDASDLAAVVDIERVSSLEPWREASFREELTRGNSFLFAARTRGVLRTVVGYACSWLVLEEIHILNVAVHPAFRLQGVGRALLLHTLEAGRRRDALVALLEVRESNARARRLYESLGFRATGKRPNYYGLVREPAVLMELEMNGAWDGKWLSGSKNGVV